MLTLILGGARSGKSSLALRLASERGGDDVAYIAPCEALDEEMAERIRRHQAARPARWQTIEEPLDLGQAMRQAAGNGARAIIIDCLTLWLSNAMQAGWTEETILGYAETTARAASELAGAVIAVTNEVGMGIVPPTELGRRFRDQQGRVNQTWAAASHEAMLVVAGLALSLK